METSSVPSLENFRKPAFRRSLLRWYAEHKRDLPWRRSGDPYAIWVSEIMLQQTQVATVIPYYLKFLERFPTVNSLAEAKEEDVMARWAGLGYYRRARLLQRGAKQVLEEFSGKIPETAPELRKIAGIGAYTAGAIASIAFNKPEPLVDGNVVRVLSRILALKGHAKSSSLQREIWRAAAEIIDPKNPGDFNQALMELGATVCRVVAPHCEACPVSRYCEAYQRGQAEEFPEPPPPSKVVELKRSVAVCWRDGGILLVKRAKSRWFQGLWELPHDYGEEKPEVLLSSFLKKSLGVSLKDPQEIRPTRHGITRHRIVSYAWQGELKGRLRLSADFEVTRFFSLEELEDAALSNFDRKVLRAARILKGKSKTEEDGQMELFA